MNIPIRFPGLEGVQRTGSATQEGHPFLVPGETVEATVLQAPDTSSVVILVKGIPVEATSQIGRLHVGQVIQARVEPGDGQILLRVMSQSDATADAAGGTLAVGQRTGEPDQVVILLRSLLPAGESLSTSLNRLVSSARASAESGLIPDEAATRLGALVGQLRLHPEAISADAVRQSLRTLGLEYEHGLLERLNQGQPLSKDAQVPTLKSWLLSALAERGAEERLEALPVDRLLQGVVQAFQRRAPIEELLSRMSLVRERLALGVEPDVLARAKGIVSTLLQEAAAEGTGPKGQPMATATPLTAALRAALDEIEAHRPGMLGPDGEASVSRLLQGLIEALQRGASTGEIETLLAAIRERIAGADDPKAAGAIRRELQALIVSLDRQALSPGSGTGAAAMVKARLVAFLSELTGRGSHGLADLSSSQPIGWRKDALEVLKLVERTQVVNALNAKSGQPLMFELPVAWPGASSVRLYVERREEGTADRGTGPRPYRIVTMLDLPEVGPIRVDAVFAGKQVTGRVLVERAEVGRFVSGLLPTLHEGLTARGFVVAGLSASVSEPRHVRGEELDVKSVPHRHLLNIRA
jgi:hypothetical protein